MVLVHSPRFFKYSIRRDEYAIRTIGLKSTLLYLNILKPDTSEQMVSIDKKSYPKDVITIEENLKLSSEESGIKTKDKLRSMRKRYSNQIKISPSN